MIANHIHDALARVKKIQELIINRKYFKGYSGTARIISGAVALSGAIILSLNYIPVSFNIHLIGWGIILIIGLICNYGALLYWFLFNKNVKRNLLKLKPAIDAIPALIIGGVLSLAVILKGHYQFLFGIWLCLYGLSQIAYRNTLPKSIYFIGILYMISGIYFLFSPNVSFLNPLPLGIIFFMGESLGGLVLYSENNLQDEE